ncbi:type II toxin-antitoxin system Phd/YefM family antitoxin [Ruminiclostridium herbifermentans]|uniref:type II toxin-antitoxin system Phd/YefM family antitoxin n=1 Tax=Ruminiclostridium herbifermentans TaxID=2488810 RepID=UPI0026B61E0C
MQIQNYVKEYATNTNYNRPRNTNEISDLCHKHNEPIFITKNGYGDLVVMSIETYEHQLALVDVYRNLAQAEQEIANGTPLLDGKNVFKALRKNIPEDNYSLKFSKKASPTRQNP